MRGLAHALDGTSRVVRWVSSARGVQCLLIVMIVQARVRVSKSKFLQPIIPVIPMSTYIYFSYMG